MDTKLNTPLHPDSDLIDSFGGPTQLAKRLGMTKPGSVQRVQNWKKRGIPPFVKLKYPEIFLRGLRSAKRRKGAEA